MKPLRSGESLTRQWRTFNELVRGTDFRARQTYNTQAAFAARPPRQLRTPLGGGFMGEYDSTKSYGAGSTFLISSATTIAGVAVIAGYYGVPPSGTDVNGLVWAGYVPANPTGNEVPQDPLPSIGSAPNDKFYAKLILPIC